MTSIRAVLFDLDGTLLDTAPDLIYAVNCLLKENNLPSPPVSFLRPLIGIGSKALIKNVFNIEEQDPLFNSLRERFIFLYENHIADLTQFFPHVENVLSQLDECHIPWGIVTNKLKRHTFELLTAMNLKERPACIICGDSLSTYKPDPAPILHACQLLKQNPENCVYIGDTIIDVNASKNAGTKSLVALYGYRREDDDPFAWQADGYIRDANEIIDWVAKYPSI
jgi:phosphoglycolate phosphatase